MKEVNNMDMSTNDVYFMLGYDTLSNNYGNVVRMNNIYNSNVPIGNQCTNNEHYDNVLSYRRDLSSGKLYRRFDYHTGDHAEFMAFCSEMHINYDNDTCGVERRNKDGYAAHIDDMKRFLNRTLFEKIFTAISTSSFKPSTRYVPKKWKWMQYEYDKMVTYEGYIGLTSEQVTYMLELRKQVGYNHE